MRKGILTPFHKLKGFERRLQQPGSSSGKNESNEEDKNDGLDSDSVVRAAHSMLEAAKARPTTKLLDSEALPKLDAPTRPFQRLKTPLKACQSPERDAEKRKGSERKRKRPLPGKKWRKSASWEDMGESGMYFIFLSYGVNYGHHQFLYCGNCLVCFNCSCLGCCHQADRAQRASLK